MDVGLDNLRTQDFATLPKLRPIGLDGHVYGDPSIAVFMDEYLKDDYYRNFSKWFDENSDALKAEYSLHHASAEADPSKAQLMEIFVEKVKNKNNIPKIGIPKIKPP